jgi:methionyl aminopeptidase
MNSLVSSGVVEQYGCLTDIKGSYSAQFEHVSDTNLTNLPVAKSLQTFLLHETHKEVLSRGEDY